MDYLVIDYLVCSQLSLSCSPLAFLKQFWALWCRSRLLDVGCRPPLSLILGPRWPVSGVPDSRRLSRAPVCRAPISSPPRWHIIILGERLVILRVSGAPCGPILMSHMWPVKKDPSDLAIRLITTQYILMSRVRSYTYNIHIHSTHAEIYICVS